MKTISALHKKRFDEIRKKLADLGSRESSFTAVKLLFYEAITISRDYGNDEKENKILEALKQIEAHQFKDAQQPLKKAAQREQAIRKFVIQFKNILGRSIQDILLPQEA